MPAKKKETNIRTPIVSILGHVDHGKTTILDKIRETDVQGKEAGGITQKISVFTVNLGNDKAITFVDTPGHEAFDLMRSRGGTIADIVLLIVAADDSVKPQTEESIEIIKESQAKPIVVINKTDLPNIDLEKVKREIASKGLEIEGMGGSIPVVEVSGKTGDGIPELLETISTVGEIEGLIDRGELPEGTKGKGYVLESVRDKSRGYVASVVCVQGGFNRGDRIVFRKDEEIVSEKIKGFISEEGANIEKFIDGHGGKILGMSSAVDLGTEVYSTEISDRKGLKDLFKDADKKTQELEEKVTEETQEENEVSEEDKAAEMLAQMFGGANEDDADNDEEVKKLNVVIKSSSEGSLEAIKKSLDRVDIDGHVVNIVDASVGDVSSGDIKNAEITKSIVLAFEVGTNSDAVTLAKERKVLVRQYEIIYKLVDEVTDALTLLATPQETEEDLGTAEIRAIFVLSNGDKVLGARVKEGVMKRNEKCYIVRNDEMIGEGRIKSLKHNKNEINEAQKGSDFGAILDVNVEAEQGDEIHCFKVVKVSF